MLNNDSSKLMQKFANRAIKLIKFMLIGLIITSGASFGSIMGISMNKGITPDRTIQLMISEVQACNTSNKHWTRCYI
jgi:hypothetical protein